MRKEPVCSWDAETGVATFTIYYHNQTFVGKATCHPDDEDMCNELTGCAIAESRAAIAFYQHIRDNELKPQLKALKQYYYSMNRSKKFNPESYEVYMLYRQIENIKNDLNAIQEILQELRNSLSHYIQEKENMYQSLRKLRAMKKGQEESTPNEETSK